MPSPVISLADAKKFLNKAVASTVDDDELAGFIDAAVERVDRHLYTQAQRDTGSSLTAVATLTASQTLAVKMVLGEYWRTQRARSGRNGGAPTDADSGPAGLAPLEVRLTELLGEPASGKGALPLAAVGSFPDPQCWPDPVLDWTAR